MPAGAETINHSGVPTVLGRIALGSVTMVLSVNLWTGFPVLALWLGSRAAHGDIFSMLGLVTVIVALAGLLTAGAYVLTRVSAKYDKLTKRPPAVRQPAPWLRSMRATGEAEAPRRREINAVEAIVVVAVVVAVIAFEVWFFFLAGSSLPHS